MNERRDLAIWFVAVGLLASLLATGSVGPARAQSDEELWSEPVNLSRSGATSQPRVIPGPDGLVQVLWWDQFDGLMTAYRADGTWTEPARAPIIISEVVGEGARAETVRTPIGAVPTIAHGRGYAHAFWLGEPDPETDIRPLLHSRLALGSTVWSEPDEIAETARVWKMIAAPDGTLHLIFLRPLHTQEAAAGIYCQRSTNGGESWSAPRPLYQTAYARLIEAEDAHVWIAADDRGRVYATWDDPRLTQTFLAVSADGGVSWSAPQGIGRDVPQTDATRQDARRARVVPAQEELLLLWEAGGAAAGCSLYQQPLTPPATGGVTAPGALELVFGQSERVLEELRACAEAPAFHHPASGNPIMVLTGDGLTTSAWNGAQWSEPSSSSLSFEHPELGRQVYLEGLDTTLVGDRMAVVGQGTSGDIWYVESAVEAWEWIFAPPPPWSTPVTVWESAQMVGLPALAVDAEGRLHAVWGDPSPGLGIEAAVDQTPVGALSYARLDPAAGGASNQDGPQWSQPVQILQSPGGAAKQPTLIGYGDQLFAVWNGGEDGTIYLSRAFARDAHAPGAWSDPIAVPMGGATASSPAALFDVHGVLHVVYAAPLNEGRGIYYLRSERSLVGEQSDEGPIGLWSELELVFDAQEAGFASVDHPALALDPVGTLHVVWVRGSSAGRFPPRAILHAKSTDGGQTWSEPQTLAEGAYDWPLVAAPLAGEVQIVWNQVDGGRAWTQRRSLDYGQTWTYQQQVRGFDDVHGPAGLTADGGGNLHLVGLGRDEQGTAALAYAFWRREDEQWEEGELFSIGGAEDLVPGVAVALLGPEGRLEAAFRARMGGEAATRLNILHARRAVVAAAEGPQPAYTPVPTVTPTPPPTAVPTATPRPAVMAEPPPREFPTISLGPLALPLITVGGIGVALAIVFGVLVVRASRARR